MRFNSPDSWSPFGEGGLNAYGYCGGDPRNRVDPNGHKFGFIYSLLKINSPKNVKLVNTINNSTSIKIPASNIKKYDFSTASLGTTNNKPGETINYSAKVKNNRVTLTTTVEVKNARFDSSRQIAQRNGKIFLSEERMTNIYTTGKTDAIASDDIWSLQQRIHNSSSKSVPTNKIHKEQSQIRYGYYLQDKKNTNNKYFGSVTSDTKGRGPWL
jgi:hypothetical protein